MYAVPSARTSLPGAIIREAPQKHTGSPVTGETANDAPLLKIIEQLGQRTSRNVLQSDCEASQQSLWQNTLWTTNAFFSYTRAFPESAVGAVKSSYGALLGNEEQRVAAWTKAEPALCHCYPVDT